MGGGHGYNSPCASCKLLRRRCAKDCVFAPYFPPDDPLKFAIVHKVFGASNVSKMLQEVPLHQRADAVSSLVYEANARARDPVYGCVGAISYLQTQVAQLQMQLAVAQADIFCIQMLLQQDQLPPLSFGAAVATNIPMAAQLLEPADDHDDKSFFLQNNLPQLLNFTSSNTNAIYDSYTRESLLGHDHMVS